MKERKGHKDVEDDDSQHLGVVGRIVKGRAWEADLVFSSGE